MFTRSCVNGRCLIQRVVTIKSCTRRRHLLVLGIESSCDDTGAAIVDSAGNILADRCESQLKVHLDNGGIIPPLARDLHVKHIDDVVCSTLDSAGLKMQDIDAIAVTSKPGLPLSLAVGVNYAQQLAIHFNKPLIPVHHMQAHATIGLLPSVSPNFQVNFPFITLLISGGHSQIALARSLDQFYTLGETLDDAPGEMMDKIARRLKVKNLGHPYDSISGGAALELLATQGNALAFGNLSSTVPLSKVRSCDFSFAGFKNFIKTIKRLEDKWNVKADEVIPEAADLAASIQLMTTIHLLKRLSRAFKFIELSKLHLMQHDELIQLADGKNMPVVKDFTQLGDSSSDSASAASTVNPHVCLPLIVSGGVASSTFITSAIQRFCDAYQGETGRFVVNTVIPRPKKLCCDNGIMIAVNGMLKLLDRVTGSPCFTTDTTALACASDIIINEKHNNNKKKNEENVQMKLPHACDDRLQRQVKEQEDVSVTGDTGKKYRHMINTFLSGSSHSHIHTNEDDCKCMNSITPDVQRHVNHVNNATATSRSTATHGACFLVNSSILTSHEQIASLVEEPKAALGISLREAVLAANIKPDPIKVSLVLARKEVNEEGEEDA